MKKLRNSLNQGLNEGKENAKPPQILKRVYIFYINTNDNF